MTTPLDAVREVVRELVREIVEPLLRDEFTRLRASLATPQSTPTETPILTVAEVADLLHVTPPTVRLWIQSGALKATLLGADGRKRRVLRIARKDLVTFLTDEGERAGTRRVDIDAQADKILTKRRRAHGAKHVAPATDSKK